MHYKHGWKLQLVVVTGNMNAKGMKGGGYDNYMCLDEAITVG